MTPYRFCEAENGGMRVDRAKKRRRMARKRLFVFAGMTLLLALILLVGSLGAILISVHIPGLVAYFGDDYSIRYYTAESPNTIQRRFSYKPDFILRDGNLYMDFSALAELCGFAVSGDYDQRRYLLGGEYEDTLTVNIGTTSVIVSGQPTSLRTPSFLSEAGSLYLPCEFVDSYFDGISVEADENNDHLIRVIYDSESGYALTIHQSPRVSEALPPDE